MRKRYLVVGLIGVFTGFIFYNNFSFAQVSKDKICYSKFHDEKENIVINQIDCQEYYLLGQKNSGQPYLNGWTWESSFETDVLYKTGETTEEAFKSDVVIQSATYEREISNSYITQ